MQALDRRDYGSEVEAAAHVASYSHPGIGIVVKTNHADTVADPAAVLGELDKLRGGLMQDVDALGGRVNSGKPVHASGLVQNQHRRYGRPGDRVSGDIDDEIL